MALVLGVVFVWTVLLPRAVRALAAFTGGRLPDVVMPAFIEPPRLPPEYRGDLPPERECPTCAAILCRDCGATL
jgi:hypothetical protein